MYTKKVIEHFTNPKNVGFIKNYDGVAISGDQSCGDFLIMTIKIKDNKISDLKYKVFGCPASISTASALSVMAIGMNIPDALKITDDDVVDFLGELPEAKIHCSLMSVDALQHCVAYNKFFNAYKDGDPTFTKEKFNKRLNFDFSKYMD